MRTALLLLVIVLVAAAALLTPTGTPSAEALVPSEVVGEYRLKLKGEGGLRSDTDYDEAKVREKALLVLSHADDDPGSDELDVEIRLVSPRKNSLLERGTPESPQFRARGVLVGNSMALIDTGTSGFANVLTLRFLKGGKKVAGGWISALPADASDRGPLVALHVNISGKRLKTRRALLSSKRAR